MCIVHDLNSTFHGPAVLQYPYLYQVTLYCRRRVHGCTIHSLQRFFTSFRSIVVLRKKMNEATKTLCTEARCRFLSVLICPQLILSFCSAAARSRVVLCTKKFIVT